MNENGPEAAQSEEFVDLLHLASSLVDPKSEHPAPDRLRTALPAALAALRDAPHEQVVAWVRSARSAGVRFEGSDDQVARRIRKREA